MPKVTLLSPPSWYSWIPQRGFGRWVHFALPICDMCMTFPKVHSSKYMETGFFLTAPNACFQPVCCPAIISVPFPLFLINGAPLCNPTSHLAQQLLLPCPDCYQLSPILSHRPYKQDSCLASLFLPAAWWSGRDYWRKRAAFGAVLPGYWDPQKQYVNQRGISPADLINQRAGVGQTGESCSSLADTLPFTTAPEQPVWFQPGGRGNWRSSTVSGNWGFQVWRWVWKSSGCRAEEEMEYVPVASLTTAEPASAISTGS